VPQVGVERPEGVATVGLAEGVIRVLLGTLLVGSVPRGLLLEDVGNQVATTGVTNTLGALAHGAVDQELVTTADLLNVVDEGVVDDEVHLEASTLVGILEEELRLVLEVPVGGLVQLVLLVETDEGDEALVGGEGQVVPGDIRVVHAEAQAVEEGDTQNDDGQDDGGQSIEDVVISLQLGVGRDLQPVHTLTPGVPQTTTGNVLGQKVVGETVQVVDGLDSVASAVLSADTIVLGSEVGVLTGGLEVVGLLADVVVTRVLAGIHQGAKLHAIVGGLGTTHHLL